MAKNIRIVELVVAVSVLLPVSTRLYSQEAIQVEREAMYRKYLDIASYVKGGHVEPHWMADGSSFWYTEYRPNNTIIWKVDPTKRNAKKPFFDVARLRNVVADKLGHTLPGLGLPFDTFDLVDGRDDLVTFKAEGQEITLDLNNYVVRDFHPISDREGVTHAYADGQLSPDENWLVGRRDNTVWLRSLRDGEEAAVLEQIVITDKGNADVVWGKLLLFDVEWSPNSKAFAFYRIDVTKVFKTPLVDYVVSPESLQWVPNWFQANSPLGSQELFMVDPRSRRMVNVQICPRPYEESWFLGWLPDSSELLLGEMDRHHRNFRLTAASPSTGRVREILKESHKTYINGYGKRSLTLVEDGKQFVWKSQRDDWSRLYLYDLDGTLVRTLTTGDYHVDEVVAVNETQGWIYFIAFVDRDRPYDAHLCRINFDGVEFKQLTNAEGQHRVEFAPSKQFFLDSHSSPSRPPKVELKRADGTLVDAVSEAPVEALEDLKWSRPEEFVVKSEDGKATLHGIIYRPYDFDPTRKYAVIDSMYDVPRDFVEDPLPHALSQLGFVVTMVNARRPWIGGERGREFEEVTYGSFGRYEIPERVHVLKELAKTRPYLDLDRVGIFGGSFPGYFAVRGMLQAPDTYHVGVAVAPVIDLYTHANYLWLGPPESNEAEYRFSSNTRLANRLKGRLLLIHGTADYAVPMSHAMKMADALIRADKPFNQMILPGWGHWSGKDHQKLERYWMKAAGRYFVEHLRP